MQKKTVAPEEQSAFFIDVNKALQFIYSKKYPVYKIEIVKACKIEPQRLSSILTWISYHEFTIFEDDYGRIGVNRSKN